MIISISYRKNNIYALHIAAEFYESNFPCSRLSRIMKREKYNFATAKSPLFENTEPDGWRKVLVIAGNQRSGSC